MVNVARVGFGDEQLAEVWHAPAETGFDSRDHLQQSQQFPGKQGKQAAAGQGGDQGAASSCGCQLKAGGGPETGAECAVCQVGVCRRNLSRPTSAMALYSEGCWEREDANLKVVDMVEEEEFQPGGSQCV